ncbi:hypothetical protein [Nitrospirillum sp. BR 11163]|uniref:hypothetical protein n=1 Tax=Nitrospirillum sp. BR 11163 TaxID=3104323 RepID=UPI002AFEC374|nr:hypothetical protein [Nitrospirillum sp. BR 11163]MEA1673876.1 hypothetical protein [Nitrospirillum sp. BR 11163]
MGRIFNRTMGLNILGKALPRARLAGLALVACLGLATPQPARASDHADPTNLTDPTANITDLFFYPEGDDMILIFDVNRALLAPKPYNLAPYDYEIHMDLTTPLSFQDPAIRARYGGTVLVPDQIHSDVTIKVKLQDDVTVNSVTYTGLKDTDKIKTYFGVRDDPFVFPQFFKKNAIAMVMRIPKSAFPADQHDFILWGTTAKNGTEIDHVGRSIRTQLPRFGFINTMPPKDQLKALMARKAKLDNIYNYLHSAKEWWAIAAADFLQFTLQLRPYDLQPDVMVYTDRFPVGYPNGRLLTDDVVAQTCAFGDCLLQEISFIEGPYPRATVNDKPFSSEWPYLAPQWPDQAPAPSNAHSVLPWVILGVIVLLLVSWGIVEIIRRLIRHLLRWWWRRIDA